MALFVPVAAYARQEETASVGDALGEGEGCIEGTGDGCTEGFGVG